MGLFNLMLGKKDPVIPSVSLPTISLCTYNKLRDSNIELRDQLYKSEHEFRDALIAANARADAHLLLQQKYINLQKACNCIAGSKAMNKIVGK